MDIISTYPNRIGEVVYLPADKVEVDDCLKAGTLDERTVMLLKRQSALADATPETFQIAVARRPAGSPWPPRGFTEAYLKESGLLQPEQAPAPVAKAAKTKPAPEVITHVKLTDEKIPCHGFFVQPKKNGRFTLWDAVTADGELLRNKSFRRQEDAVAFIEGLSTGGAAADSPVQQQEAPNDGDVRPSPGGAEGQDPAADR